ncbi:hypothetical protein LBYZC6_13980 [Lacrimispora brassicae]
MGIYQRLELDPKSIGAVTVMLVSKRTKCPEADEQQNTRSLNDKQTGILLFRV